MNGERRPRQRLTEGAAEAGEHGPRLIARVTFSRHEETTYSGVGRDITDAGIKRAQEKGASITREKGAPSVIGHSPRERARGTAESIEEGVHEGREENARARWIRIPGLRSSDVRDKEVHGRLAEKLGTSQEAWAHAHHHRPDFFDNPEAFETNEEKRARMYRELDRLVAFLEKQAVPKEPPHLVFVSHYELITLLLDDVFGIHTFETPNTPSFGQHVDIDVYEALPGGEVPMRIHFNGKEQDVLFDRASRRLVARTT